MIPDRAFDELVDTQVFGRTWPALASYQHINNGWACYAISEKEPDHSKLNAFLPAYSSDLDSAFLVAREFVKAGFHFMLRHDPLRSKNTWTALFQRSHATTAYRVDAETPELAICYAALQAKDPNNLAVKHAKSVGQEISILEIIEDTRRLQGVVFETREHIKEMKTEVIRLTAALKSYGDHHRLCEYWHYLTAHDCNCGFVDALKSRKFVWNRSADSVTQNESSTSTKE